MSVRNLNVRTIFDPLDPPAQFDDEPSMTKQSFREESDINSIMARYAQTGYLVDPLKPSSVKPSFGDFGSVPDFHHAQEVLARSYELFDALPANVRARFANDPAVLLEFLSDESNRDEAVKLGICSPVEVPDVSVSEPVSSESVS